MEETGSRQAVMTDVQEQKPEHDADQKDILAKDDHQVTVWRIPK